MKELTRRGFIARSLITGTGLTLAGRGIQAAPFARVRGANEAIRIGVIGIGSSVKIGGKGKADIRDFLKISGVRITALCDPDRAHLEPEAEKFAKRNETPATYTDLRAMLDDKNVDAVSITTPNHWHALAAIWACQAGKDVYVQKPASHNIWEGRKMVEAARKYQRMVLCTSGPRSRTGIGEAFEYVHQGNLGKILYVHGLNYKPRMSIGKVAGPQPIPKSLDYSLWSGPQPESPVMREYLHYDWHWDWRYGNGDLGNMGIHYMDACRWALGQDTLPRHVLSIGGRFGYEDDGETPNTMITFLDYDPAPIVFEVRGLPKNRALRDTVWTQNSKATMDAYKDVSIGVIVHCEHGYVAQNRAYDKQGALIKEFAPTNVDDKTNFIQAVRSRRQSDLYGDILEGHLSAALVHMTNISYRVGQETPLARIRDAVRTQPEMSDAFDRFGAHLDANEIDLKRTPAVLGASLTMDPQQERFVGAFSELANTMTTRSPRKGFAVPETV
jgi:predicted dehydrogenase